MITEEQAVIINNAILADPYLSSQPMTPDGAYTIAQTMNTPSVESLGPVTVGSMMVWAAEGPRVRIGQASVDPQQPESIRASCQVFLDLLMSGPQGVIQAQQNTLQAIFDSWVPANVITQAEYDQVYEQPNGLACTLIPQSVSLINQTITFEDVQYARTM